MVRIHNANMCVHCVFIPDSVDGINIYVCNAETHHSVGAMHASV